jgi:hypothetical protein
VWFNDQHNLTINIEQKEITMKTIKQTFGIAACIGILAASATSVFAQGTNTLTLAALAGINGGGIPGATLTIDDKTFSDFTFQASGLNSFNPSDIIVTATESGGIDYLTWYGNGNISLSSLGFSTADLLLNYTVTANPGTISMIDQRYLGTVQNGSILINETATSAGAPTAHSQLSVNDASDPNTYPSGPFDVGENDLLSIAPPQSTLYVTKDISLVVIGGSIIVDQIQQSFHQVPEPSVMLLGSLGGGLLLLLNSRRRVKRD